MMYCEKKCEHHVSWLLTHNEDSVEHYTEMGCLRNGIPHNRTYIKELIENIGYLDHTAFVVTPPSVFMLELGCGVGMYVPFFLRMGWIYEAVEMSKFAAYWTRNCFDVTVHEMPFEELPMRRYDLIFGAHVFEHVKDSPAMLKKSREMLMPTGKLVMIVPDDTDPVNPSHWWFFNKKSLKKQLEAVGFENVRMVQKKIVAHEDFIYCVADRGRG